MPRTLAALLLAGCGLAGGGQAPQGCDVEAWSMLIGASLAVVSLPDGLRHRIVRPGDMLTQDYDPARLNLVVDETGRILRVWCG